jgi:HAD superfamily hydrolase (TIGR01509 family)
MRPITMAIRAAVFDLGGVVCDFLPERRLRALAAACGLPAARVHALLWESSFSRDCDLGCYSAQEAYAYVRDATGLRAGYDEFLRLWSQGFEPRTEVLRLIDTVRAKAETALFTNNGAVLLDAFPSLLTTAASRFDRLIFSCELKCTKPDAEAFRKATKILGWAPAEVVFVDDTPANVRAAAEHGWCSILYTDVTALWRQLSSLLAS